MHKTLDPDGHGSPGHGSLGHRVTIWAGSGRVGSRVNAMMKPRPGFSTRILSVNIFGEVFIRFTTIVVIVECSVTMQP